MATRRRYASDAGHQGKEFLGTYGYERGRLNKYHVTAYTVETKKTAGNKHVASADAWGRGSLKTAKGSVRTRAHHRKIKTVVYNRTRKRYVGKNRVR